MNSLLGEPQPPIAITALLSSIIFVLHPTTLRIITINKCVIRAFSVEFDLPDGIFWKGICDK
jgi:hypothetical protein